MGDIVNVKNGYARNFLLPQKGARATEENKKGVRRPPGQLEAEPIPQKEAEAVTAKSSTACPSSLFGRPVIRASFTAQFRHATLPAAISEGGFTVDRNQIVLDKPIKSLGLTPAKVQLHPEVVSTVSLSIARSQDEADKQACGENVAVVKGEALELETFDGDAAFEEGHAAPAAETRVSSELTVAIPASPGRPVIHKAWPWRISHGQAFPAVHVDSGDG
jgi:large subunit ribosomal protein L9